jgi:hypothetical protein
MVCRPTQVHDETSDAALAGVTPTLLLVASRSTIQAAGVRKLYVWSLPANRYELLYF